MTKNPENVKSRIVSLATALDEVFKDAGVSYGFTKDEVNSGKVKIIWEHDETYYRIRFSVFRYESQIAEFGVDYSSLVKDGNLSWDENSFFDCKE